MAYPGCRAALRWWPYSAAWGPFPAGILGVVLIVVLICVLTRTILTGQCARFCRTVKFDGGKVAETNLTPHST